MKGRAQRSLSRASWAFSCLMLAAALLTGLSLTLASPLSAQGQEEGEDAPQGYIYTVQEGDSWGTVAERTGVSVEELKAANPQAIRSTDWLIVGEELTIPIASTEEPRYHTVESGESWNSIATLYGISSRLLQAANPQAVRPGLLLYRGERLVIPPADTVIETPTPAATSTATATSTSTTTSTVETSPTLTEEATPEATPDASGEVTTTVEMTETEGVTTTPGMTETGTVTGEIDATEPTTGTAGGAAIGGDSLCPENFSSYPETMLGILEEAVDGPAAVNEFLEACGASLESAAESSSVVADLTGDEVDDLVLVYRNPVQQRAFVESDLIIFNSAPGGYELGYRARAAGEVRLLSTEDINGDTLADVVWVDTTCGASTCFDTINVRSWDGGAWSDWTDGTITMAYAAVELTEALEEGTGTEIVLDGGIYGSVGAGPQRSRVEVWASLSGAPYTLVEKTYNASECLYHTVVDANRAFLDAPTNGFDEATALYTQAATDEALIKCWVRADELEELRSFSLFRLALIAAYQDDAETAANHIAELTATYPDSIYDGVGQVWHESYEATGDVAVACGAAVAHAEQNPGAWEILADYGYTNPSFEAVDVCPVLDFADEAVEEDEALEEEDTGDGGASEEAPTGTPEPTPQPQANAGTSGSATAALPDCAPDLTGYADLLAPVLQLAAGDSAAVENWLTLCGVLTGDLGAVVFADIDGDSTDDALVFPVIISDLGFGPGGAQGSVLIYHAQGDGTYALAAAPEIYGLPAPLAVEDLNDDGRTDVAWTVTGCSTFFCVIEAQMMTWNGDSYETLIRPGATIPEGTAYFEPVPDGDPGQGNQLVLDGGVSGTPEGGLSVPHAETWQSVDGGLYQRVRWLYDRSVSGSSCMGLRLVEADVALQASDTLGYGPAIDLYTAAIDPSLEACSLFGMPADEELILLQGLASFRLIQAQALSGDVDAAEASLAALAAGQPDMLYTQAAEEWLNAYTSGAGATAACAEVRPIFDANTDLWQITSHFGYNHPELAPEQICYVP